MSKSEQIQMLVMLLNEAVGQTSPAPVMIKNDVPFITGKELEACVVYMRRVVAVLDEQANAKNPPLVPGLWEAKHTLTLLNGATLESLHK